MIGLGPIPSLAGSPMLILAIDTSFEACAVGIAGGSRAAVILSETIGRGHAERLFGIIAAALAEASLTIADIDRFAVTVGPGSFTGVRVGIAAARGFALATGKPAVGLSTLAVHAASAGGASRPILAVLPARGEDVYAQLFGADGAAETPPAAGTAVQFAEIAASRDAVLAGAGAAAVARLLPPGRIRIAHERSVPDMDVLLRLAAAAPANGGPPRPLYLRPPDATRAVSAAVARQ